MYKDELNTNLMYTSSEQDKRLKTLLWTINLFCICEIAFKVETKNQERKRKNNDIPIQNYENTTQNNKNDR